jgi:hypothetical protein
VSTPTPPRHAAASPTADGVQPRAGRTPTRAPAVSRWAILLAVLVLAAGVVGIRDALLATGALHGSSYTRTAASYLDGLTAQGWMLPAGIAATLLGLWVLLGALRPRRRTQVRVEGTPGAWMRPADVAKLAHDAADTIDGVVTATATATRRTVTVRVATTAQDGTPTADAVTAALHHRLRTLQPPPRVKVTTRYTGGNT